MTKAKKIGKRVRKREAKKAAKRAANIKRQEEGGQSRRRAKKAAHLKASIKKSDIRYAKAFGMGSPKTWKDIASLASKKVGQVFLKSITRQKELPKDIQHQISKFL